MSSSRMADSRMPEVTTKRVVALLLAVLAVAFIVQNTADGRVRLFWWKVEGPVWLWMTVLFVAGLVVGSLFPWGRRRSR